MCLSLALICAEGFLCYFLNNHQTTMAKSIFERIWVLCEYFLQINNLNSKLTLWKIAIKLKYLTTN